MIMLRTCLVCLMVCVFFVVPNRVNAQDQVIESLQGEWTLLSMTRHGGKVNIDEKRLSETAVSIKGNEFVMSKYWQLLPRNYNPETKTAEGYLDGDPGHRFSMEFRPPTNQVDLIVKGLVPASAEDDLSDSEQEVLRTGTARFAGIYSLKGNTLTICFDEKVPSERPAHFSGKAGADHVRLMLERKSGE